MYGNKNRDSLNEFKEHNGFAKVDVPRYYVPLTLAGHLALRFSLHHPLASHVPETVLKRLRDIRGRWNTERLATTSDPA